MKSLLPLLLLLVSCAHRTPKPKFKVGDCVSMSMMTITNRGEWDSSGYRLGEFKILEIIHTDKMNIYMNERLHARDFYKVKVVEDKYIEKQLSTYVIPVEDLDGFRYADIFWQLPENNTYDCNAY